MDRKKELKMQYKQTKTPMGLFIVRSKTSNKCFIDTAKDLNGAINGAKFRLQMSNHPNRELQKEWKEQGESAFTVEILETLDYDSDESKTDYSDDLETLKSIWEEKLASENLLFYNKRG